MTNHDASTHTTFAARCVGAARAAIALGTLAAIATLGTQSLLPEPARAAASAPVSVEARYRISYGSLKVGELTTSTRIAGDRYEVEGEFRSGGVARLMSKTRGTAKGEGRIGQEGLRPDRFALSYRSGRKERARSIAFEGGRVAGVTMQPKRERKENWVPVGAEHLASVLDPVGGIVVAGDGPVCGRTLRAFDGEMRIDVTMAPRTTRPFKVDGHEARSEVCSLRFEPIAGYKKDKSTVRKMRELRGAEAEFVRLPGTSAHQLVRLTVPTSYGKVSARATTFRVKG